MDQHRVRIRGREVRVVSRTVRGVLLASLAILISPVAANPALAQAANLGGASLAGVVTDELKAPIPGVTVTVTRAGEERGATVSATDAKGQFRFAGLRPGKYVLEAALDGFQSASRSLTLVTGQVVDVAFRLVPAFTETAQVTARAETGEVAVLESRRQAPVVSDSISSEEIRKTPDSNAAGVVERLAGVTLVGNRYVYVRGLGERYSGATINGATLPTTETEKRVVPLDLFPAKLLESVNVIKTYTPDRPGDFGSGIIEMATVDFPSSATLRLTVGAGHHSSATGEEFGRYSGGLDFLGDGGQTIPSVIPREELKRRTVLDQSGYSPEELERFGDAFVGSWTGERESAASPATDFAITYGNTLGPLGVIVSGVSSHGYAKIEETQRFFGLDSDGDLVPRNDYELTTDQEHATSGFVANVALRLTENNRLSLNSVLTRDATSEDRFQEGLNTNAGGLIRDARVRYQLEEVFSGRLRGEHNLSGPGIGSLVEWSLAYSDASNESDLRENLYQQSSPGVFALQLGVPESGRMDYFDLSDGIRQGGLAYSVFLASASGGWSGTVKAGYDHLERTRDFQARRFRFVTADAQQFDLTGLPEEIFVPENIRPTGFEIREITGVNDAYDAEHTVGAGYLMADLTFGKWRFIGGARHEDSDQRVATFDPFQASSAIESIDENRDLLPALNVVYQYAPRTNLRFGYGRSVNRPDFRELSPFTFVEVTGGRSIAGNPDLRQATLDSLDVRWESFPGPGEVIAASAFYKKIADPIERIIQPTTELRTSFVNADSATLWGLELEFRRSLSGLAPALRWWSVNFNYAYIDSDVTVGQQQLSVVTNTERPLQGQSDQGANLALQFLQPEWGTMVRVLGSYIGKRLTDVGAFGLPDIYEAASTSLDLVLSQELRFLANGLELKVAATNLLDEAREYHQGDELQRRYQSGRTVGLSVSYSPF